MCDPIYLVPGFKENFDIFLWAIKHDDISMCRFSFYWPVIIKLTENIFLNKKSFTKWQILFLQGTFVSDAKRVVDGGDANWFWWTIAWRNKIAGIDVRIKIPFTLTINLFIPPRLKEKYYKIE